MIGILLSRSPAFHLAKVPAHLQKVAAEMEADNRLICPDKNPPILRQYGAKFGLPPSRLALTQMVGVQKAVLVDPGNSAEQNGLFEVYDEAVLAKRFSDYDALCNCVFRGDEMKGVYLICPNQQKFPPEGKALLDILEQKGEIRKRGDTPVVLVDLIVQLPDSKEMAKEYADTPHSAEMRQLNSLVHAEFPDAPEVVCVLICRTHPSPNKALKFFERIGWKVLKDAEYRDDKMRYAVATYRFNPLSRYAC